MRYALLAVGVAVLSSVAVLACSSSGPEAGTALDGGASDGPLSDATGADDAGDALAEAGNAADAGDSAADSADGGSPAAAVLSLTVSTGDLVPAFDAATTDYTVTSLDSLYPIDATATVSDPSLPLTIHGAPAQSGVPSTFKLQPKEDFTVAYAGRTYTVHYVPSDLPAYTVTASAGAGSEELLLTPARYLLIVDRAGAPLYYRTFAAQKQTVENFQRFQLADGTVYYAAAVGTFDPIGLTFGVDHVMDAQFHDVADVQLAAHAAHPALPAEGHDFRILDHDHYVVMTYVQRTVDLSGLDPSWSSHAQVYNAVVQELSAGNVVFEWDSANVPSLYADSTYDNDYSGNMVDDYLHMNSIEVDPKDGNFIFSFRYTSSVVKVDRNTGQILWTLGGKEDQFGLTSDQIFSWQHYVRVQPDGSLMVFDNGNNLHQTRILSFVLDEANKKVTSFTDVYDKPAGQPETEFMGSYAHLDTTRYLFGWGGWSGTTIAPAATEVVAGTPVWSLTFTAPSVFSYRALPVTSL